MTKLASLLLFVILSFSTIARAQEERAPHGVANESPLAFSPDAYGFFNPDAQPLRSRGPCPSSDCMTLTEAATVQSTPAHESRSATPDAGRQRLGAGSIASIPIALVFALILGLGVYFVVFTRRTNAARAKAARDVQQNV